MRDFQFEVNAALHNVRHAALNSIVANDYADPSDPHADASAEHADEGLALAARELVRAVEALPEKRAADRLGHHPSRGDADRGGAVLMPSITLHTARESKPCAFARHYEDHTIKARDLYVRSVAFPGDEGHEEGTRPWVMHVCVRCADVQVEWVRHQYQVPVTIGCRVIADGNPGRVAGGNGSGLLIVVDGERRATPWHPTWRMEYVTEAAPEAVSA